MNIKLILNVCAVSTYFSNTTQNRFAHAETIESIIVSKLPGSTQHFRTYLRNPCYNYGGTHTWNGSSIIDR